MFALERLFSTISARRGSMGISHGWAKWDYLNGRGGTTFESNLCAVFSEPLSNLRTFWVGTVL